MFRTERLGGGNDISIWRNEKTRYMLLLSFVPVLFGVSFTSVERGGKGALVKRVRNGKAWLFVWKMMYSACISQISFSYARSPGRPLEDQKGNKRKPTLSDFTSQSSLLSRMISCSMIVVGDGQNCETMRV